MLKMIDGIILLNKPQGLSSNAALQRVKHLFAAKKAGHTGSLDPLATGMLPICLGEATKVAQYLLDANKCYDVVGRLGVVTDSGDAMGAVIRETNGVCSKEDLLATLLPLQGETSQVPPMYSALKHQGKPLYSYARKGIEIERMARTITIDTLVCNSFDFPYFSLTVTCSKGTYIRSLVEAIGENLGLGAHVTQLHRVYTAGLELEPMYTLDELMLLTAEERLQKLLPITRAIHQFPVLVITEEEILALQQGKVIPYVAQQIKGMVQLQSRDAQFVGLGDLGEDGMLRSKRLVSF